MTAIRIEIGKSYAGLEVRIGDCEGATTYSNITIKEVLQEIELAIKDKWKKINYWEEMIEAEALFGVRFAVAMVAMVLFFVFCAVLDNEWGMLSHGTWKKTNHNNRFNVCSSFLCNDLLHERSSFSGTLSRIILRMR